MKSIKIPVNEKNIYYYFLIFTKPLHKLRPKEIELTAEIIYKFILEKDNFKLINDCWKKVFSYESKIEYCDNLNIKDYNLQNLLSSLRRKKVIVNNRVTKNYIPDIKNKEFKLMFNFKMNG